MKPSIIYQNSLTTLIAILIDSIIGDPQKIYNKIPHPVVGIGKWIGLLDGYFNKPNITEQKQLQNGKIALGFILGLPVGLALGLTNGFNRFLSSTKSTLLLGTLSSTLIAQRSLYNHVECVAIALEHQDIKQARFAVSQIVGRQTDCLDESGISRAAIESLAENFSDGITAPILWSFVGGFPGLVAYKTINTADSMIGHFTQRYRYFGRAAAKVDDWVNLPASRLSAFWIMLASNQFKNRSQIAKEAKTHRSPNAGWPEAAMAFGAHICLGGPRHYAEETVSAPWMGQGRKMLGEKDIRNCLKIFRNACFFQAFFLTITTIFLCKNNKLSKK